MIINMAASVVTWAGESNQMYFLFIYIYTCILVHLVLTGNYVDIVYRFSRNWSCLSTYSLWVRKSHAVAVQGHQLKSYIISVTVS